MTIGDHWLVREIRKVQPPLWTVLCGLVMLSGVSLFLWLMDDLAENQQRPLGEIAANYKRNTMGESARVKLAMITAYFAVGVGAHRGSYHNPIYWSNYAELLQRAPWHAGRPLPMGPLRLSLGDLVLFGPVAVYIYWFFRVPPGLAILIPFVLGYVSMLLLPLIKLNLHRWGYVLVYIVLIGLNLEIRWTWSGIPFAILAVLLSFVAVRRFLNAFQKAGFPALQPFLMLLQNNFLPSDRSIIYGWPWKQLHPRATEFSIRSAWPWAGIVILVAATHSMACLITAGILTVMVFGALIMIVGDGFRPAMSPIAAFVIRARILRPICHILAGPMIAFLLLAGAMGVIDLPDNDDEHWNTPQAIRAHIISCALLAAALPTLILLFPDERRWTLTAPLRLVPIADSAKAPNPKRKQVSRTPARIK